MVLSPAVIVSGAGLIVTLLLALLGASVVSPAKLAPPPVGYVPALMPARLTLLRMARPLPLVVAVLPAKALPLSVKVIVLPPTPLPLPYVNVACRVVVPPKAPVAAATLRLVASGLF